MLLNIIAKSKKHIFNPFYSFSSQKAERQIYLTKLIESRIKNSNVIVQDMSEGHQQGVKYTIYVESDTFRDTSTVQQHNLVKNALRKEWKKFQYVQIRTKIRPKQLQKASAPNTPGSTNPDERRILQGETQTETPRGTGEMGSTTPVMPVGGATGDGNN